MSGYISGEENSIPEILLSSFMQDEYRGVFSNGMHYYIKENAYDTQKASLRLAVKIGSIVEEEEERGLAHFLEHMVFRGTKSYSDGEVIKYLESIGAAFGADTNAYTTYDETVYMLEIPLNKENSLRQAFSILSEFAMKATLSSEQLEIEKGVVLDELRSRESSSMGRVFKKSLESFLTGTLYEHRSPIGLEEVIKTCTEEKMKNFYAKWYRPENMAIIAVGDFSKEEAFSYAEQYFAPLPTSEVKSKYIRPHVTASKTPFAKEYKDPESIVSLFFLGAWLDNLKMSTKEDIKTSIADTLILSMMDRRLEQQAVSSDPPFSLASILSLKQIHPATLLVHVSSVWDEDPLKGLAALASELQRASLQDFEQQELDIAIAKFKASSKEDIENCHHHRNAEYTKLYLEHFMHEGILLSFEDKAKLFLELADQVDLKAVNVRKEHFFASTPSIVYAPSGKAQSLTEEQMLPLFSQTEFNLSTQTQTTHSTLNIDSSFEKGSIVETHLFKNTGVKKLVLSNGMKVYLEPSDLKENLFSFILKAPRGFNACDQALYPSAFYACSYLQESGLAGLSQIELEDAKAGKNVDIDYTLEMNSRTIEGYASNEDMNVAFKLLQALFTDRTYREGAWNKQMKKIDTMYENKDLNPEIKFQLFTKSFNSNNHYFVGIYPSKSMSKSQAELLLDQAFGDPSEFTLVIVGDYQEEQLKACLETYLASIPPKPSYPEAIVKEISFPEGIHHRVLEEAGIIQESKVVLTYPLNLAQFKENYLDFYKIDLAENILQTRLLNSLRVKAGETYGVSVKVKLPFYPQLSSAYLTITFTTSPDKVQSMTSLLLEEMQCIDHTPPTVEEISKAVEIYKHQIAKITQMNEGKVYRLFQNLDLKIEPNYYLYDIFTPITPERLHETMKGLFNLERYTLHTQLPNKTSL
jgi:zinc protease